MCFFVYNRKNIIKIYGYEWKSSKLMDMFNDIDDSLEELNSKGIKGSVAIEKKVLDINQMLNTN